MSSSTAALFTRMSTDAHRCNQPGHRRRVGDVGLQTDRAAAERLCGLRGGLAVDVDDHDPGAAAAEEPGGRVADATGAAGDKGGAAGEGQLHGQFLRYLRKAGGRLPRKAVMPSMFSSLP